MLRCTATRKLHTMNLITIRYAAVSVFLVSIAPISLRAQDHQLVFTEQSSTVLTATLDGSSFGTVVNQSADHWLWTSPTFTLNGGGITLGLGGNYAWQEPGAETGVNGGSPNITIRQNVGTFAFELVSDSHGSFGTLVPNGAVGGTVTISQVGNSSLLGTADVRFVDQGDNAVPDASSTSGLLLLSVGGVLAMARLPFLRRQVLP